MKVWSEGRIGPPEACRVSVLDHGLLYGDGVFEGIRITARRIVRLADHLARLARSALASGLELPYPLAAIADIVRDTARAHGTDEAYVRLVVTRGEGELTLDPTSCHEPRLFCIVTDMRLFPPDVQARGLRLMTAAQRRPRADQLDPQVKSLNYLNNVLAKQDARRLRFDDALLLNDAGRIAEASGANVCAMIDGVLVTPPPGEGALPGLTRRTVLECWQDLGGTYAERPLTRYELLAADEAFLCGSGAGIVAIASLDDRPLGQAGRDAQNRLASACLAHAREHGTPF